MRINKVQTSAFAISATSESHFLDSISKKYSGKFDLTRSYMPLVLCNAIGDGRNKGYSNKFFISLTTGSIYFIQQKGYTDSIKKIIKLSKDVEIPELTKSDLLSKIRNLPPELIKEFGGLMETGTTRLVGLDNQKIYLLNQLVGYRLAETYTHQATDYVKPVLKMPSFTAKVFDLSKYFEIVSIVDEAYSREHLVYVPEQLCILIALLYGCKVSIDGIVYLPYLKASYMLKDHMGSEIQLTAFPKKLEHQLRKYEQPHELKPLMLGIKGEGMGATPLESPILDFSNVVGMEKVKEEIKEAIIYPFTDPQLSKEFGQKAGGGILLYGPPGCGKTFIVRATVGEAGVNFFSINVQDIIGEDPNVGAKKLHDVFEEARSSAPSVIFFDEIDALAGRRESGIGAEKRLINQFLSEMDGLSSINENVLVIGATNTPWGVDPAIRRAGRFTTKIYIPPPDFEARKAIFKSSLKGKPVKDIDLDKLAERTNGYSSADLPAICDEAAKIPWEESLKGKMKRPVSMDDFTIVLRDRGSSLIPWFRLAEKQLESSGESDVYTGLWNEIQKYNHPQDKAEVEDASLNSKKDLIKHEIEILKKKYSSGDIGGDIYKELLEDYEKKLIELEAESP